MGAKSETTKRAKRLRKSQTESEGLLWSLLRSNQLCGLQFRRQHAIGPFFADFACISQQIVVELDGGYHDHIQEDDLRRQQFLIDHGWKVIRFANEDVLRDAEAVIHSIASQLGLPYTFKKRTSKRSGMMSENAPHSRQSET
jgi:very-short-patch-repair endonuclease